MSNLFVIDTTEYSGYFDRELCAYITGLVGECKTGKEDAKIAKKELDKDTICKFKEIVRQEPDEHEYYRPSQIYITPGYFNVEGNHYKVGEEDKARKDFDGVEYEEYPAYQSVAIFFHDKPSQQLIDLMKERAKKFFDLFEKSEFGHHIDIIGFRWVEEIMTTKEEVL